MTLEELQQLVQSQAAIIQKQTELIQTLQERVEVLETELNKYKNSNTPPSANKHLKPDTRGQNKNLKTKQGAPKGHKGTTRRQTPDRKEIIDADCCPHCGSKELNDKKVYKKIIEEILEPVVPEVVEYEIHKKECSKCGHTFVPEECSVPLKGKFGINILVLVVFLKYILRGVL